jgi:hypothetical protein
MSTGDSQGNLSERSRAFFATIIESCLRRIDRVLVPILGVQDDQIRHDRTGVLYRIADDHFVLTAAHDLQEIVKANIPLHLSMNQPGVMPVSLGEARFHSTEQVGRDVTAIWLPPECAREVAQHKDFLSHNQIDLNGADTRGPFILFGYPMNWSGHIVSEDHIVSKGLVFVTFPHDGPRLETAHYAPSVHMLLNFTRDAIKSTKGNVDRLPKLHGISGCGVWQVGDKTGNEIKPRDEESVTLVAIQHRWFPDLNYVQATKIRHTLGFVIENFPAARAAMNIAYPKP